MRIAVVTSSYPHRAGDASGHFVANEAALLASRGHDVSVCAPGDTRLCRAYDAESPVDVVRLGSNELFSWPGALPRLREHPSRIIAAAGFVRRTQAWLNAHGPFDRVVAHWLMPCGWPIASGISAPLEVVCHGSDLELFAKLPMLVRRYVAARLLARRAQLRFVSCHQQAAFANVAPDLCEHSFVEPCAIDTSMAPARTLARESLGIAGDARIALVIGRLIASKRVDVALSGLTRASALTPIVIGDGPLRASLAAQYPEVTFKGQLSRPETLRWLAAADLLVSASNREGSPTVIREARQLRVPVIAQEVGDLRSWARLDPGIRVFRHPSELAVELARFQGDVGLAP